MANLHQKKFHLTALAVACACAGLTQTLPAWAQSDSVDIEEIMVTATRRSQRVQDIPFNISAVSGSDLADQQIVDSVDVLRSVAGVSVVDRGYRNSGMTNGIVIRGMNVDSGSNGDVPLAAVPTVATYVDDTALYANFILKDIERVEVLRGPQGTLFGSGSLAGTVRYIMNKPSTEGFEGQVSVNYGQTAGSNGNNLNLDAMVNIPLGDNLAVRVNAGKIDNDGIVDYVNAYAVDNTGDPVVSGDPATSLPVYTTVKDADTVDIDYYRASVLFAPNDVFNAQLTFQHQQDDIGGRRQATRGADLVNGGNYGDYENGAVMLEPSERKVDMAALELEVDLGFATLTSSTSDYSHTGEGISDNTGFYAQVGWLGAYYGSSPRPFAQAERFYDDSAFVQELRLVSNGDNSVDWTVGLYYADQDSRLGQNSFLPGYAEYYDAIGSYYVTEQDFEFRRNQQYKETAVFGEATYHVTENVHVTLGGRYFKNENTVDASMAVGIYGGAPVEAQKSESDDDILMKANIAFDVTDNSMLYATISEGYRHGGANAVPTTGTFAESPEYFTFESDKVINYEMGYKGTAEGIAYSASLYYTDWKNPQLNTSTNNWGFFAVVNGESARTQGLELEVSGRLSDSLSYSAGYTYADAELTADAYKPAGNWYGSGSLYDKLVAEEGSGLPGTSEHVFNLSIAHDVEVGNAMHLTTVLTGYYQSASLNALGSDDPDSPVYTTTAADIDAFQLWNLTSTLRADSWSLALYLKNIANEAGTTGLITQAHMGSEPSTFSNYYGNASKDYLSLPRTFGASLTYNF